MTPQIIIATYTTGMGDSFGAVDLSTVLAVLEELHGGAANSSTTVIDCNSCGTIGWVDNCDCDLLIHVAKGRFYGDTDVFLHQ